MTTDPVCYRELDERVAEHKLRFRGKTYFFHSDRCRRVFESNPDEYAAHIPEKVYGDHPKRHT